MYVVLLSDSCQGEVACRVYARAVAGARDGEGRPRGRAAPACPGGATSRSPQLAGCRTGSPCCCTTMCTIPGLQSVNSKTLERTWHWIVNSAWLRPDGMRWLPPPTALWRAELSLVVCCGTARSGTLAARVAPLVDRAWGARSHGCAGARLKRSCNSNLSRDGSQQQLPAVPCWLAVAGASRAL